MQWPFVTRARLDALDRHWQAMYDTLSEQLDAERKDNTDLLERYHDLKIAGAIPTPPDLPVKQPLSTDLADEEAAQNEPVAPVAAGA